MARNRCQNFTPVILAILTLGVPSASNAASNNDALVALGLCKDMEQQVDAIVDYTQTKCIPALSDHGNNFIFVSSKPVFSVEAAEKAWILIVTSAYGHEFNKMSDYRVGNVYLADTTMVPALRYYVLSGELAKKLQKEMYEGQVTPATAWDRIVASMKPYKGSPQKK